MRNKFLNYLFLFIITTAAITFNVNAESGYLYDVLKNEAESGGLAKEYTGEHHDSFTEEPSKKIYHWYAANDTEGNQVLEKNNVIFANYCWQIIRTTDTGGVKMIYNGVPNNGVCNSVDEAQTIGGTNFNTTTESPAYVGYMLPAVDKRYRYHNNTANGGSLFGTSVTYSDGMYILTDTSSTYDNYHHYSCNNRSGTCSTVRYYYYAYGSMNYYFEMSGTESIEELLENMLYSTDVNQYDSTIKEYIDNWYQNYMLDYTNKLEDTIFCNDRSISQIGGFNPNGGIKTQLFQFNNYNLNNNLACSNITDKFSMSNSLAKLTYPIGLMTAPEANILNNNKILAIGKPYWLASPTEFYCVSRVRYVGNNGELSRNSTYNGFRVRPMVSLIPNIKYVSGNGSKNNPYDIRDLYKSNINIENDNEKGIISNLSNTTNIEELSNVTFTITTKEGYILKELNIKDINNNSIEYTNINNEYSFVMPSTNVTITPIYEKVKHSVNVEIVNETEDVSINIIDMTQVEYDEEVIFKVTPIKGYKVNSIKILDENDNEIEYTKTDDTDEYIFTMPSSNVTIIPSYEKVSNAINVEDNKSTKEIIIQVDDSKAVVYEDIVKFTIVPEDDYEVEDIEIIDNNNNKIEYRKTDKDNEYEFIMPDTGVVITPSYRLKRSSNNTTNPKTGNRFFIIVSLLLLIISVIAIFFRKKERV